MFRELPYTIFILKYRTVIISINIIVTTKYELLHNLKHTIFSLQEQKGINNLRILPTCSSYSHSGKLPGISWDGAGRPKTFFLNFFRVLKQTNLPWEVFIIPHEPTAWRSNYYLMPQLKRPQLSVYPNFWLLFEHSMSLTCRTLFISWNP